jgi:hypothetical protein
MKQARTKPEETILKASGTMRPASARTGRRFERKKAAIFQTAKSGIDQTRATNRQKSAGEAPAEGIRAMGKRGGTMSLSLVVAKGRKNQTRRAPE